MPEHQEGQEYPEVRGAADPGVARETEVVGGAETVGGAGEPEGRPPKACARHGTQLGGDLTK